MEEKNIEQMLEVPFRNTDEWKTKAKRFNLITYLGAVSTSALAAAPIISDAYQRNLGQLDVNNFPDYFCAAAASLIVGGLASSLGYTMAAGYLYYKHGYDVDKKEWDFEWINRPRRLK